MVANGTTPARRSWGAATDTRLASMLDDAERHDMLCLPRGASDRNALKRRAHKGLLLEPRTGMFVRPAYWNTLKPPAKALHIMRAVSVKHPNWTFCGPSAAAAYGLPVTWRYLDVIHVAGTNRSSRRQSGDIVFHVVTGDAPVMTAGIPATSFWRTVFDCLLVMEPADALAVADAALRLSDSTRERLLEHLRHWRKGHVHLSKALGVAGLSDPLSESGGESIARMTMLELGFEHPLLQLTIPDPLNPSRSFRTDYGWLRRDGKLVLGEHDGREKSENRVMTQGKSKEEVQHEERLRESRLTLYGFPIVRFGPKTVRSPYAFARLLDSFGVPRRNDPELTAPEHQPKSNELFIFDEILVVASVYDGREFRVGSA